MFDCRHLHLRQFDSATEYGKLWSCQDCPAVFINLPSTQDHDLNQSVDLDELMDDTSSEDDSDERDMLEEQENHYADYMAGE